MQYNQVKPLAQEIATALGEGWAVDSSWDANGVMIDHAHADGVRLHIRIQGYESDKVSISGVFPYPTEYGFENGDRDDINVSISRGAATIAKEINRRLMPRYLEVLAKVNAANAKADQQYAQRQARTDEVYAILGKTRRPMQDHERRQDQASGQTRASLYGLADGYGDVTVGHDGSRVSIDLHYVPAELALEVLRTIVKLSQG